MSLVSSTTTSGAASGDHSAGLVLGSDAGSLGKAQPPPPGQTLLFRIDQMRKGSGAALRPGMIFPIVPVAIQEFLRKIRKIMIAILVCGRR